jgi:plastocyanin
MRKLMIAGAALMIVVPVAFAATGEVEQNGQRFSVTSLTVPVGDSLHFNNHDDVKHNISVFDADGNADDLGLQDPGVTITKLFDKKGDFTIRCAIHPRMKMSLTVK